MSQDNGGAALSSQIKDACDAVRKAYCAVPRGPVEALLEAALVAVDNAHTYQVEQEREAERARELTAIIEPVENELQAEEDRVEEARKRREEAERVAKKARIDARAKAFAELEETALPSNLETWDDKTFEEQLAAARERHAARLRERELEAQQRERDRLELERLRAEEAKKAQPAPKLDKAPLEASIAEDAEVDFMGALPAIKTYAELAPGGIGINLTHGRHGRHAEVLDQGHGDQETRTPPARPAVSGPATEARTIGEDARGEDTGSADGAAVGRFDTSASPCPPTAAPTFDQVIDKRVDELERYWEARPRTPLVPPFDDVSRMFDRTQERALSAALKSKPAALFNPRTLVVDAAAHTTEIELLRDALRIIRDHADDLQTARKVAFAALTARKDGAS